MIPDEWGKVRELFEAALDVGPEGWDQFVARAAEDDEELRAAVSRMLDAHRTPSGRLEPPVPSVEVPASSLAPGAEVDSFRIVRAVAQGGMGAVYEAVQEPLGRRVALKTVLFPAFAGEAAHRRFRYEGELLARLSHPHVAQIHASGMAGSADDPQPWIAMEFVEGARDLLRYATDEELDRDARLALFGPVCAAVGYAHERGVLHRDLKPSNLLVDETGTVKLIDFGIARATEQGQSVASTLTRTGELVGTLRYMSPEQLRGDGEGGVRSEVYSLGVVLHELLCGEPPVDVTGMPITEAIERLAGEVRVRPRPDLPAELTWILQRALEQEPRRRYAGVGELGRDLARHREGLPIEAAPPGSGYRIRKFVARNRVAVVMTLVVFLSVAGAGAAAGWGWFESRQAHAATKVEQGRTAEALAQLEDEAEKLRAANRFLFGAVVSSELYSGGHDFRFSELLEALPDRIDRTLGNQPAASADLYTAVVRAQRSLGLYEEARANAERGLEAARRRLPPDDFHIRGLEAELASLLTRAGELAEAERLFEGVIAGLAHQDRIDPQFRVAVMRGRAQLRELQGRIPEAVAEKREALDLSRELLGAEAGETIEVQIDLALSLSMQGEHAEARALAEAGVEQAGTRFGPEHPRTLIYRHNLATILGRAYLFAEGVALYETLLPEMEQGLGPHHDQVADAYNNYATDLSNLQRLDEAATAYARAIEVADEAYGPGSARARSYRGNLAAVLAYQGRHEEARECYREMASAIRAELGYHPDLVTYLSNLSWTEMALGNLGAAIEIAEDAIALGEEHAGPAAPVLTAPLYNLAQALAADGQTGAAIDVLTRLVEVEGAVLRQEGGILASYVLDLVKLLLEEGLREDAVDRLEAAVKRVEERGGEGDASRALRSRLQTVQQGG